MENNKGQSIFLSVVGIATLLVAIVGATFAYFSIQVTGNETASSIRVTTAIPGGVTFIDGDDINIVDVYPGWRDTKTFTISSDATADATTTIEYDLKLDVATTGENNLATAAAANNDFVYTFTSVETGGNTDTSAPVPAVSTPTNMPAATTILGTGTLAGAGNSHTYVMTIVIPEKGIAQDELQGKTYAAVLQVIVDTDQGQRTWDTVNGGWKQYTEADDTY